jgi:hypothetical protein
VTPYPPAAIAELAGQLELQLLSDGEPANPLAVLELDRWRDAPPGVIRRAAELVAGALPITVGVLAGPPAAGLEPLISAATLTLTGQAPGNAVMRQVIAASELPVATDVTGALGQLRAAVSRSPRAAITCGQLLRQTAALDTAGGLAAEAAAYSLLLGGREFARWLIARGAPRRVHRCGH